MNDATNINRRTFLKTFSSGFTVTLSICSLPACLSSGNGVRANKTIEPTINAWAPEPGVAKHRIDGIAKVIGDKIFARDFRSRDLTTHDWPSPDQAEERLVHALRVNRVDRTVTGYDLSILPDALRPITVVDHKKLLEHHLKNGGDMKKDFFVNIDSLPLYYGQPVAMLIFKNFDTYRKAKKYLQFNNSIVTYGEIVDRPPFKPYRKPWNYVKDEARSFSFVQASEDYDTKAPLVRQKLDEEMSVNVQKGSWQLYQRKFNTQAMDPMFMEPEAGLAYYNSKTKTLKLLLGTQSPQGDIAAAASIFSGENCTFKLDRVDLISCYPGGGFGGRDSSYFSMYLAVTAPFSDGHPIRWAHDRFEQFQVGLKRHQTEFTESLCIDKNGMFQALNADFILNGGGRENLSPYVAQLAAICACSAYNIPKAMALSSVLDTPDLLGGSQRGFGCPQAFLALETLIDEASNDLNIDPFKIRRKNLLKRETTSLITGAPIQQDLQLSQILDALEGQSLWQKRFVQQSAYKAKGLLYGVGLAVANKAYGTSGDGMFAGVQIKSDGSLTVRTPFVDMGNGAATTLSLAPSKFLGRNASHIQMGDAAIFDALDLTNDTQSKLKDNYVYMGSGSTSACLGAFHNYHAVEYSAMPLLANSVVPALKKLWNINDEINIDDISWHDGKAYYKDFFAADWGLIVDLIFAMNLPTLAVVHASYVAEFATARFNLQPKKAKSVSWPIDYIALGSNEYDLKPVRRSHLVNPAAINSRYGRSLFAASAAIVATSVNPKTGEVVVEDCITALSSGKQHCPQLVSGQSHGAVAMAIGYTLSEDCPVDSDGPGDGTWNLHKYHLMRVRDIPLKQKLIVLDPPLNETTARGIGEAVLCPIPAAILNSLAMATKHRFNSLPVTSTRVLEALT